MMASNESSLLLHVMNLAMFQGHRRCLKPGGQISSSTFTVNFLLIYLKFCFVVAFKVKIMIVETAFCDYIYFLFKIILIAFLLLIHFNLKNGKHPGSHL